MIRKVSCPFIDISNINNFVSVEPFIGRDLCFMDSKDDDGNSTITAVTDVFILMNNKRIIEDLGIDTVKNWLSQLQPGNDRLASAFDKLSDDELFKFIKSRHIQSPSDLLKWSKYINDNLEFMSEEAKRAVESSSTSSDSSDNSESDNT